MFPGEIWWSSRLLVFNLKRRHRRLNSQRWLERKCLLDLLPAGCALLMNRHGAPLGRHGSGDEVAGTNIAVSGRRGIHRHCRLFPLSVLDDNGFWIRLLHFATQDTHTGSLTGIHTWIRQTGVLPSPAVRLAGGGAAGAPLRFALHTIVRPLSLLSHPAVANLLTLLRFLRVVSQTRIALRQDGILAEHRNSLKQHACAHVSHEPLSVHDRLLDFGGTRQSGKIKPTASAPYSQGKLRRVRLNSKPGVKRRGTR